MPGLPDGVDWPRILKPLNKAGLGTDRNDPEGASLQAGLAATAVAVAGHKGICRTQKLHQGLAQPQILRPLRSTG